MLVSLLVCVAASAHSQQRAPAWRLVEEARIDGAREDLGSIGFVVALADGAVVLSEPQDARLRFFDAGGRSTKTFGREGRGPGEFVKNSQLRAGRFGDTLWVHDMRARQFTFVSSSGTLISTVREPTEWNARSGRQPAVVSPFAMASTTQLLGQATYGARTGRGSARDLSIVSAAVSGEVSREIAKEPDILEDQITVTRGTNSFGVFAPFRATPHRAVAPDGSRIVLVSTMMNETGGLYHIDVFRANGDTVARREFAFAGIPVSKAAADSAVAMKIAFYKTPPAAAPPDAIDEMERRLRERIPRFMAPVELVHVASDHSVWLQGPPAVGRIPYTILNERGEIQGTLALPLRSRFGAADRTTVWIIETDADDVPSVVRYRINR